MGSIPSFSSCEKKPEDEKPLLRQDRNQELWFTYRGIERVVREGAYLDLWFRSFRQRYPDLPARPRIERRLRGVLEQWIPLSSYIQIFLKEREGLKFSLLRTLLVGAYRLLNERVPPFAVLNEAVESLPQRSRGERGVVNAILRRISERGKEGYEHHLKTLSLAERYGFPPFWERSLRRMLPEEELPSLFEALRTPPPLYVGAASSEMSEEEMRRALAEEGIEAEPTEVPQMVKITKNHKRLFFSSRFYHQGKGVVQDKAIRAFLHHLLLPRCHPPVWDPFAAPGGKILFLSAHLNGGVLLASDQNERRLGLLIKEARRTGIALPLLFVGRCETPPFAPGVHFPTILCDLPCTASGTVANHPEVALRIKEEDLHRFGELQYRWLLKVAEYLEPGGTIWFTTCSLFPEENEDVVERFRAQNPHFTCIELPHPLGSEIKPALRFLPHHHRTIGFVVHALRSSQ